MTAVAEQIEEISLQTPAARVSGPALRRSLRMVTLAWVFGNVWGNATAGAPITEFARGLGASDLQFGILSALPFLASFAAMPASYWVERTGRRKLIFLLGTYLQRVLWIPIALLPLWILRHRAAGPTQPAMLVFLLLMLLMNVAGSVGSPAWTAWMADLCPPRIRGKYFSRRRAWSAFTGIAAAVTAGWIMDRHGYAGGMQSLCVIAMIFVVSVPFGMTDVHLFHYIPALDKPPKKTHWLRALREPLRDRQFVWFAGFVAVMTFALCFMGQFATLYLCEQVHVSNTGVQLIVLAAPMLAQLLVLSAWGHAADRMGKKPVLAIACIGLVPVGFGWMLVGHQSVVLAYVLSAAGGMLSCGIDVANFNLVLEMSARGAKSHDGTPRDAGSSYVAMNSVIINIAGCLGGIAAGYISQWLIDFHWTVAGLKTFTFYDVLFVLSGLMRLLAVVVFLPHIRDPLARPARQALRFITANICNNLFGAILSPWRSSRLAGESDSAKE